MLLKNAKLYGQEGKWDIAIQKTQIHSIQAASNDTYTSDDHVIDLKTVSWYYLLM